MQNKNKEQKKKCRHKRIYRYKTYESGDCYYYNAGCENCKKEVGGWTMEECEKEIKNNL